MRRTLRVLANEVRVWADRGGWLDDENVPSRAAYEGETLSYTVDWTGFLGSDTISTSIWAADGSTLSGDSSTTKTATTKATSPTEAQDATITNTITTAAGLTAVARFRLYSGRTTDAL